MSKDDIAKAWGPRHAPWYAVRRDVKPTMWALIGRIIEENGIKTLLEIGGGIGAASQLVSGRYLCVDGNPTAVLEGRAQYPAAEFLCADWLEMSTAGMAGEFEMVLACAVVEHCADYKLFIERAAALRPAVVVIEFMRGPRKGKPNHIQAVQAHGGTYYENVYSRDELEAWLTVHAEWTWELNAQTESVMLIIHPAGTDAAT